MIKLTEKECNTIFKNDIGEYGAQCIEILKDGILRISIILNGSLTTIDKNEVEILSEALKTSEGREILSSLGYYQNYYQEGPLEIDNMIPAHNDGYYIYINQCSKKDLDKINNIINDDDDFTSYKVINLWS